MSDKPFGISYQRNTAFIKLRFKQAVFNNLDIKKYGMVRTTQTGFVIFETELNTYSVEYHELMKKLGKKPA